MNGPSAQPIDLGIPGITGAVEIGAGGFGIVYRAVEDDLGRTVAVKVLTGNLDEGARYRFERERRAMGRLSGHPNIVTIYRGGYTAAGNAYLVMEFLDRGSLAERLAERGSLPWQDALKFGIQLSGALETSHRAGVLHRDIKPANILLSNLGAAKLCDFGIARLQGAPETRSSVVTASLSHAPPDIVNGQRPDARSDVYSLASTMFELVAATPPFVRPTDESMVPILARITQDPVPALPEETLPGPVFAAIERAMAKEPGQRPASAAEFGQLLLSAQNALGLPPTPMPIESVGADEGPSSAPAHIPFPETTSDPLPAPQATSPPTGGGATPPSRPPAPATQISDAHDPTSWDPPTVEPPVPDPEPAPAAADAGRPPWLLPVAGLAVAALVAVGAIVVLSGDGDDDASPTSTTLGSTTSSTGDGPGTSTTLTLGDDGPGLSPGDTVPGSGPTDYETYVRIEDDSGSIGLNVPVEWTDVSTRPGQDGSPFLAAAETLFDGFFDTYDEPGVSVTVRNTAGLDLDTVLDSELDENCTPRGRRPLDTPNQGLLELLTDCDGSGTQQVHMVFVDRLQELTAVMRVQVISDRDLIAAQTMTDSLTLNANP